MASIVNKVKSLATGRSLIGITGIYNKEKYTLDLDCVESWTNTHNTTVTSHPIEKDTSQDNYSNITDHVNISEASVSLDCLLATNTNLISRKKAITEKEKLQILLYWQASGSIVQLEGYGTGTEGFFKKLVGFFDKGVGALYSSTLNDPNYLGTDTDIIKNLVLGNIVVTRKSDIGTDLQIKVDLKRIKFAIPKTSFKNAVGNIARPNNTAQPTQAVAKPVVVKESSTLVKTTKTVKK